MPNPWTKDPDPGARMRLVCLPYAGGGTLEYRAWASSGKAPWLQILPIVLPGRETRMSEPAYKSMAPLVNALLPVLRPYLDKPYAIFGHSMGSWVAQSLVWRIRELGLPMPARVFVSGRRAPHVPDRLTPLHNLPEQAFVAGLQQRYGAIPAQLLANRDLLAMFLPSLRADLQLLETFACPDEAPVNVPLTAWAGETDDTVRRDELEAWQRHTTRPVDLRVWPGGHFFVRDRKDEVLDAILAALPKP